MNPARPLLPPSPLNPQHQQLQLQQQHQQQNQVMVPIPQQPGPPPTQPNTQPPPLPPNLPCRELIEGSREEYLSIGVPLYEASIKGDWKAAEAILEKRPELVRSAITENFETPLHIAASFEMYEARCSVPIFAVFHVKLGHDERESDALHLLKTIWKKVVIMPKKDIDEIIRGPPATIEDQRMRKTSYPSRVLFLAAKMGNTRFIIELIRSYPDLIWKVDDKGLSIFHIAVKRRQAEVYNLLYEIGSMKDLITPIKDKDGNNMLHLVGKSAKPKRFQTVSGVALQMQRELLWFQEVQQMIPPAYRQRKNVVGEEPHDIFTKNHVKLVEKGEEWMKETAAQCMVVATLIATIVFAAGFTLPGGYDQNTGFPMFRPRSALVVFVIADSISLIFSSTSVLIFLSILTSRYAERDFLESLPKKLMSGLGTLFLSIVTMMVAFSSSFFLLYHKNQKWIPYMVTGFAAIPVILFAFLQSRLLLDVFYSTYRSRYLFKPKKHALYY